MTDTPRDRLTRQMLDIWWRECRGHSTITDAQWEALRKHRASSGPTHELSAAYQQADLHFKLAADLVIVLRGYEAWEGRLIMEGDWSDEQPKLTRSLYDEMMELQARRNSALSLIPTAPVHGEAEALGRFGHHPDAAIDFCVEVERIENVVRNQHLGLARPEELASLETDVAKAMQFRVGGDIQAIDAKAALRKVEHELRTPSREPAGGEPVASDNERGPIVDTRQHLIETMAEIFMQDRGQVPNRAMFIATRFFDRITALAEPQPPDRAAVLDIVAERARQVSVEGWTVENDDLYVDGEMAVAAGAYVLHDTFGTRSVFPGIRALWPWSALWWKPTTRRRNLVKAGAMIVAEIERLDRAAARQAIAPEPQS